MIVKKLDALNLLAIYENQYQGIRNIYKLQEGRRVNQPISFFFPYTTENGDNLCENKELHVILLEITDQKNIVNPTLAQGVLNLGDKSNKLFIEKITNRQSIPLNKINEIVYPQLTQLLDFKKNGNRELIEVIEFLASNPQILKSSMYEFFEK